MSAKGTRQEQAAAPLSASMRSPAEVLWQSEAASLCAATSTPSRTSLQQAGIWQHGSKQQDRAGPDLLDGLVQEGFEGCNADVPQLCCDASTPLHKFDVVEVVLHSSEVGKAKGCECRIPPPVNVLPPLDDLSSIDRYGWHRRT